jgi:uncharacterized membrane protein YfbV (UPF0208 family)
MDSILVSPLQNPVQTALASVLILIFLLCSWLVVNSKRAGLSHIPGPFLARYTNAWSLYIAWKCVSHANRTVVQQKLQAQYGDVVRTGPRSVTVLDPAAVPVIYGVRSKLDKVGTTPSVFNKTWVLNCSIC